MKEKGKKEEFARRPSRAPAAKDLSPERDPAAGLWNYNQGVKKTKSGAQAGT